MSSDKEAARTYLAEHKVDTILTAAVADVIKEKPKDPIVAIAETLNSKATFAPPPTAIRPTSAPLTSEQRSALSAALSGIDTFFFGDDSYWAAREAGVEGRHHEHFPAVIVFPSSEADVVRIVKHAMASGIAFSVRCGGHAAIVSMARTLVIHMEKLSSVEVDSKSEPPTITAGGGALAGMIDAACAPLGIATTCGNYPGVGFAGQVTT